MTPAAAPAARLGIVDWGIGGLGVLRELERVAPGLAVTYWSDTGAPPYGLVPTDALADRLGRVVAALADDGCTEVLLACNAASTVADRLGGAALPVEGIIGHGVAAVPADVDGLVGIVGGRRTIRCGRYQRALARSGRVVRGRVAQPLSAHLEAGRGATDGFRADLARIVAPLRGASALVLACTHYPAAADAFAAALPGTRLVDPAATVAAAVAARHPGPGPSPSVDPTSVAPDRRYVTTGDPVAMVGAADVTWSISLPVPERRAL